MISAEISYFSDEELLDDWDDELLELSGKDEDLDKNIYDELLFITFSVLLSDFSGKTNLFFIFIFFEKIINENE